jgi:hypothetical protein
MTVKRTKNPAPGEKAFVVFSELDVKEATVLQYEEHPLPGACDLTTEFLMLDIPGMGVCPLTRHSILPAEEDAEWCLIESNGDMVEIVFEHVDIMIGPAELIRLMESHVQSHKT